MIRINVGRLLMWIRARFDIGWTDIWSAGLTCALPMDRELEATATEHAWDERGQSIATLSVRSAFDLALRALDLPPGSEVLLTALTIPDMIRIVSENGLHPVPVDVDDAGRINIASLEAALTDRSRVLVVAHLFGGRCDMDQVVEVTRRHKLILIEDCAQCFARTGDQGHPGSDFTMHSFGPIKTATAMGGGMVHVTCKQTCHRMRQILTSDPVQPRRDFFIRTSKIAALKVLTGFYTSAAMMWLMSRLQKDVDEVLNSLGRGFTREQLLPQIRLKPSAPLLRLMRRRWSKYDFARIERRKTLGQRMDQLLSQSRETEHSYWVYPIFSTFAKELALHLRSAGFDATAQSRMTVVPATRSQRAENAERLWKEILFLPWHAELTEDAIAEMCDIIQSHIAGE